MRSRVSTTIVLVGLASIGAAPIVTSSAWAQDASAVPAATPSDGEIIYARDVHHAIGQPYFPGAEHSVVTAPTRFIVSQVAQGLQPLRDDETANVSAYLSAPRMGDMGLADLAQPDVTIGTGSHFSATETAVSSIGSTIDRSMASMSEALRSLSIVSGSNK